MQLKQAVDEFLDQRRIAVAGVSRNGQAAANAIYRKLKRIGYDVFALNPSAERVEGDRCYANLAEIPGGVDGVVIVTRPEAADQLVRECAALGIPRVWMHRGLGAGSVSASAAAFCREHGITCIAGGCPMMFCRSADVGHKCLRWFLGVTGGLPQET